MEQVPYSETFDPGEGRGLAILGSTGSIGTQALDVVRAQPGRFSWGYLRLWRHFGCAAQCPKYGLS